MATIQTRLTSDNKQHDEAFKKSKQQVYNYNKQVDQSKASVLKFAKGGLGALGAALGVAGGAMAAFNKTMKATQKTSDAFDNIMAQSKASVDYFFTSLSRGDFSGFLNGLGNVIKTAKEAQVALDNLQTSQLLLTAYGSKYYLERSNLEKIIKDPKTSDAERKKAQDRLGNLPDIYKKEINVAAKDAEIALIDNAKAIFAKYDIGKYLESDYIPLIEEILKPSGEKRFSNTKLAQINDEDKKTLVSLYTAWNELLKQINQLDIENFRLEKYGNTNTTSKSTKKEDIKIIIDPAALEKWEKNNPISDPTPINTNFGSGSIYGNRLNVDSWIGDIEKKEWDLAKATEEANKELERQQKIFDLQLDSINSLSSVFSTLGNAFESDELNIAGIITQAIANIIKGYSEASAQSAELGPWAWVGFSVAGLAQIASVISQIHSLSGYANGGIIGGNSYTGDKVLARVNSGEMILNPSQQANLFNMINGGVNTGGEVKFRIEGSTLVGVLNNYTKKTGRVL